MDDSINAAVTATVRAEAGRRSLTQVELGRRAGMTQTTMCRRYANAAPWHVSELVRVARALDVPVSLLIGGDQ